MLRNESWSHKKKSPSTISSRIAALTTTRLSFLLDQAVLMSGATARTGVATW